MNEVPDPKEAMRQALEAKKASQSHGVAGRDGGSKSVGGPHGKEGGKRQFRRKAGG